MVLWLRLILTNTRTLKKSKKVQLHLPQCFIITFLGDVTLSRAACIVASSIFAVLACSAGILPLVQWSVHSWGRRCEVVPGARPQRFIMSMPSAPQSVFACAVQFSVLLLSFCVRPDRASRRTRNLSSWTFTVPGRCAKASVCGLVVHVATVGCFHNAS